MTLPGDDDPNGIAFRDPISGIYVRIYYGKIFALGIPTFLSWEVIIPRDEESLQSETSRMQSITATSLYPIHAPMHRSAQADTTIVVIKPRSDQQKSDFT